MPPPTRSKARSALSLLGASVAGLIAALPAHADWYYGNATTFIDTPANSNTTLGYIQNNWVRGRLDNKNNHTNKTFYRWRSPGIVASWNSWQNNSEQTWTIHFTNLNVDSFTWGKNATGGLARLRAGEFITQ